MPENCLVARRRRGLRFALPPKGRFPMCRLPGTIGVGLALLCALPMGAAAAAGQTGPAIHGVTGTMATDATIRGEGEAGHAIAEGVGRVVDGARKALPGGKG